MLSVDESLPSKGEIWHPYWLLEEFSHNMWGNVSHRKTWLDMAVLFTGNADLYGEWMLQVIEQWPRSCEHALTKPGDKRAWIGHAAVALAIGCPEDVVREAWGHLSASQQEEANAKAEQAIKEWKCQSAV